MLELRVVPLKVFRPNSRVHSSRPRDSNFRRFVPDFTDVTAALFLVDLTSRKGHETASRLKKETGELKTQRCPASKSSPSSPY